jgi:hypothetical protein
MESRTIGGIDDDRTYLTHDLSSIFHTMNRQSQIEQVLNLDSHCFDGVGLNTPLEEISFD